MLSSSPRDGKNEDQGSSRDNALISAHTAVLVAVITALGVIGAAFVAREKLVEVDKALAVINTTATTVQIHTAQLASTQEFTSQLQDGNIGSASRGGQKLCRVLKGDKGDKGDKAEKWGDGILVPTDWTIAMCNDYRIKTQGTKIQLGCVKTDEITMGDKEGSMPSPNCGWH